MQRESALSAKAREKLSKRCYLSVFAILSFFTNPDSLAVVLFHISFGSLHHSFIRMPIHTCVYIYERHRPNTNLTTTLIFGAMAILFYVIISFPVTCYHTLAS